MRAVLTIGVLFLLVYGYIAIEAVRRPLLARLAIREAVRRRGQTVLVVGGLMLGVTLLFARTSLGLRMRAAAFAPDVSRLLGVRVGDMYTVGWALASVAGSLAGVLVAPSVFVSPNAFDSVLVFGFTAAIIGGLESPLGALVGGVVLGLALSYVSGYGGAELVTLGALGILVAVLMVRPNGLFSRAQARRV